MKEKDENSNIEENEQINEIIQGEDVLEIKINEDKDKNKSNEIKESIPEIQNENSINILNTSSEIYIDRTSELNGKTVYHIKGNFLDKKEEIIRRYRDFDLLFTKLSQNWPCIFIAPISQKNYFHSMDPKVINERIYQLDNFLKISTKSEYLIDTEELKMFLNKNISNSDDFQTEMKALNPYTLKQISENYTKYFSKYKDLKTQNFSDEQSNICIEFIDNFNLKINKYKEEIVEYGEIKKTKIYREYRIATNFTDFEKFCMMDFANNDLSSLFFFNGSASLFDNLKKYKKFINNPYLVLSCWLRLKELELIIIKNKLNEYKTLLAKKVSIENKQKEITQKLKDIKEGRISFFNKIISREDPQVLAENYQKELEIQNNEVIYINNIVEIVKDYFSVEVYKYLDNLKNSFYEAIKKFAIIQKENCTLASDLWLKVKCQKRGEYENDDINDIFDLLDEDMDDENDENIIKNESKENNEDNNVDDNQVPAEKTEK